jgi:hypothetical protein
MNALWPSSRAASDGGKPSKPDDEVASAESPDHGIDQSDNAPQEPPPPPPSRPPLSRNQSPPEPPPPAPMPPSSSANAQPPTDSLSLMQLRRIVADFNRGDPVAYDFVYADTGPHAEEIDEWFVYQFWQWVRLNAAQRAFEWQWQHEYQAQKSWDEADDELKTKFVNEALEGIFSKESTQRSGAIGKLLYLVLGRWGDTAEAPPSSANLKSSASASQLGAIRAGVEFLTSMGALPTIWQALRNSFEVFWYVNLIGVT